MAKPKAVPWSQVPKETLIEGIGRQIFTGQKVMLGRITFPKGAMVPAHRHESEQISFIVKGALRFVIDGQAVVVRSGELLHIPSNAEHSAEALEETDDIDAFSPIRTDWLDGSDAYLRQERR